ncbi:MAG: DUF6635 family protein [Oleiphilaceae bacterium]|nr:DUF6635 family protein [Oleiphilaceae bacterium]
MSEVVCVSRDEVELAYARSVKRYIASRREQIPGFVDRHFGLKGSLRLHRQALGWDLLRAPVNALGGPLTILGDVSGRGLHALGMKRTAQALRARRFILETDVGRTLNFLLHSELLGLPFEDGPLVSRHDALLETLLQDPLLTAQLQGLLEALGPLRDDAAFRERTEQVLAEYVDSRVAAAEITSNILLAAGGWLAFKKMTPGLVSLSGVVATGIAHQAAIHSFWAGPWAAKLYYGVVGVSTPFALSAGIFGALLIPASFVAAFAGVLADPVQRRLGWHQKRLHRLLDGLEQQLMGEQGHLSLRDHYVARVFDLFDWSQALIRLARGA